VPETADLRPARTPHHVGWRAGPRTPGPARARSAHAALSSWACGGACFWGDTALSPHADSTGEGPLVLSAFTGIIGHDPLHFAASRSGGLPRRALEPLGLVAGMFDALGLGEGLDQAMAQDLTKRMDSLGHAVNAMGSRGWALSIRNTPWCRAVFSPNRWSGTWDLVCMPCRSRLLSWVAPGGPVRLRVFGIEDEELLRGCGWAIPSRTHAQFYRET
jgi:hypothetical protein